MKRVLGAAVVAVILGALQLAYALAVSEEPLFYGSSPPSDVRIDVTIYYRFAISYAVGAVPYRDFPIEYPPLAPLLFIVTRHFAPDLPGFHRLLAVEMFAANALCLGLVTFHLGRTCSPGTLARRLGWYTLALGTLCPLAVYRFDLLAMAWIFAAALALGRGWPVLGGLLSGSGVFLKFVPGLVVLPAVAAGGQRSCRLYRGRVVLGFLVSLLAGAGAWLFVAGPSLLRTFSYHALRGIEIGSIYAGVLALMAHYLGAPHRLVTMHSGVVLLTPWSAQAAALAFPIQAAALVFTTWMAWRAGPDEPLRHAAASVLVFMAFGKVLSPQYLLWLIPFFACLSGRLGRVVRILYLAACVATTVIFPLGFVSMLELRTWAVVMLNVRNALLILIWFLLLVSPRARPSSA
jgi:hypothetical protein